MNVIFYKTIDDMLKVNYYCNEEFEHQKQMGRLTEWKGAIYDDNGNRLLNKEHKIIKRHEMIYVDNISHAICDDLLNALQNDDVFNQCKGKDIRKILPEYFI